jgi:hypothetical protein
LYASGQCWVQSNCSGFFSNGLSFSLYLWLFKIEISVTAITEIWLLILLEIVFDGLFLGAFAKFLVFMFIIK